MLLRSIARRALSAGTSWSRRPATGGNATGYIYSGMNWSTKSPGLFSEALWETNYNIILELQVEKAGNPGQEALLTGDFLEAATTYCRATASDYTPIGFISSVSATLGDSKYNAINEIIDECSEELLEAYDYSYAGDSVGENRFGVVGE